MRTAIAALGVAAIAYQYEMDYDFRSRCLLLPTHSPKVELLARDGSPSEVVNIDRETARQVLTEPASHVAELGLQWETDEIRLQPAPKLLELIRRSRKQSKSEPEGE